MDNNDLNWLDEVIYKQIQAERRNKEAENKHISTEWKKVLK